jgi:hypothetical protein
MTRRIRIRAGKIVLEAELNESPTALAVYDALPLSISANTWGDEIYFSIPVRQQLDNTSAEVVQVGDLGYWPSGHAFCIFFGPTPVSRGNEIRPASAVNILGRVVGDARVFKEVKDGELIELEVVD